MFREGWGWSLARSAHWWSPLIEICHGECSHGWRPSTCSCFYLCLSFPHDFKDYCHCCPCLCSMQHALPKVYRWHGNLLVSAAISSEQCCWMTIYYNVISAPPRKLLLRLVHAIVADPKVKCHSLHDSRWICLQVLLGVCPLCVICK